MVLFYSITLDPIFLYKSWFLTKDTKVTHRIIVIASGLREAISLPAKGLLHPAKNAGFAMTIGFIFIDV
jgi:hypothetical protein